jgi:hypothetical protein
VKLVYNSKMGKQEGKEGKKRLGVGEKGEFMWSLSLVFG